MPGSALRGREVGVLWVGRHRRDPWEELAERYRKRISRVIPVRDLPLRSRFKGEDARRLEKESEAILAALPEPVWLVALDRRGRRLSSETFAARLFQRRQRWPHPIVFVVGSDLGLGRPVLEAAHRVLSLGPMTLGHELARLVLYEQLYRAASIEAGTGYHRAPSELL
jgi:23S rRNA (pseudouridine1915-N3)-methyltransferase